MDLWRTCCQGNRRHIYQRTYNRLLPEMGIPRLMLFQVIHVTAFAWQLLMCCSCTAGHLHSYRLGVFIRSRHENSDWAIWRLGHYAGNWERRELGKLELACGAGAITSNSQCNLGCNPDDAFVGETSMHLSGPIQLWVRSSALTDILHFKRLISLWYCLQEET